MTTPPTTGRACVSCTFWVTQEVHKGYVGDSAAIGFGDEESHGSWGACHGAPPTTTAPNGVGIFPITRKNDWCAMHRATKPDD